jgi:hypothetical protein
MQSMSPAISGATGGLPHASRADLADFMLKHFIDEAHLHKLPMVSA